ncbi:MAG: GNAT family N-acetyltransferase [Chlamydiales bacterium]|nr:GNAT family N-acetyltransferase [Chlamydiales bacterium]
MIKIAKQSIDVDLDQLAAMLCKLDKIHHKAAPERFPIFNLEKRKNDLKNIIAHGSIFYAEKELQIIAFASVISKGDKLVIEHLYVEPAFRLKKIATKIVDKILAEFPNKEIFASVYAFNSEAIKFYEKTFSLSSLIFKISK